GARATAASACAARSSGGKRMRSARRSRALTGTSRRRRRDSGSTGPTCTARCASTGSRGGDRGPVARPTRARHRHAWRTRHSLARTAAAAWARGPAADAQTAAIGRPTSGRAARWADRAWNAPCLGPPATAVLPFGGPVNPAPAAAAGSSRAGRMPHSMLRIVIAALALLAVAVTLPAPADALPRLSTVAMRLTPLTPAAEPDSGSPDLIFIPAYGDSFGAGEEPVVIHHRDDDEWLRAPFGDNLLTDRDAWGHGRQMRNDFEVDYNRVDRLRLSARLEWQ